MIGEGSLLIRCAQYLLHTKNSILGIVTKDSKVCEWAKSKNIEIINSISALENVSFHHQFDYLFSINNEHILSNSILTLPLFLPINYHDSLLPKYAGMNATNWAIINEENTHGVTWHIMEEKIDHGSILKQKPILIENNETALTLNLKCYEAAYEMFVELISDIEKDKLKIDKQDLALRTFYNMNEEIINNGIINWNQSGTSIDALIRGLKTGNYINKLTTPKIVISDSVYIIENHTFVKTKKSVKTSPGEIIEVNDEGIWISAETDSICVSNLLTMGGEFVSINKVISAHEIKKHHRLNHNQTEKQIKLFRDSKLAELFWKDNLIKLSCTDSNIMPYEIKSENSILEEVMIPRGLILDFCKKNNIIRPDYLVLAIYIVFLGKLLGNKKQYIRYGNNNITEMYDQTKGIISNSILLGLDVEYDGESKGFFDYAINIINAISTKIPFQRDIIFRNPGLVPKNCLESMPTIYICDFEQEVLTKQVCGNISIVYSNQTKSACFRYDKTRFSNLGEMAVEFLRNIIKTSQKLNDICLITTEEKIKITREWNNTKAPAPNVDNILLLIKYYVDNYPDAIAIKHHGIFISYKDLYAKSSCVARALISHGVTPGDFIPVLFDRSTDMIIAMIGVLMAGCAYVPIDKSYPKNRVMFIIDKIDAKFVLSHLKLNEYIDQINLQEVKIIYVDTIEYCDINLNFQTNFVKDNSLYVIFTSGSTGEPKGVIVTHKSVINLLNTFIRYSPIQVNDNCSLWTNINFDVSVYEIFSCLCFGASLNIYTSDVVGDTACFLKSIADDKINSGYLPPFMINSFAEMCKNNEARFSLKRLLVGVEPIETSTMSEIYRYYPSMKILNGYGPTETTVCSTYYVVGKQECHTDYLPIGRPVDNTRVYVLNDSFDLVPVGINGQLYIAGDCLAKGYLGQSEWLNNDLQEDKFLKFNEKFMYKTGDIVRWLPDGNLLYIGREDRQVKIGGVRIDPLEIENLIKKISYIENCVVIPIKNTENSCSLSVYYVANTRAHENELETLLRLHLSQYLPGYMLPKIYRRLSHVPLNGNGKVKHDELVQFRMSYDKNISPTDDLLELEKKLFYIWKELIGINTASKDDNFFDLGGDSLLTVSLIAKIRTEFSVDISIDAIFSNPTLEKLSRLISTSKLKLVKIERDLSDGPVPLSYGQQRLWFLDQISGNLPVYNVPYVQELSGKINLCLLKEAIHYTISRHDILRTNFQWIVDSPWQIIHEKFDIDIPVINLDYDTASSRQKIDEIIGNFIAKRFNLSHGPLIRCQIYRINEEKIILAFCFHHIICDDWSIGIFLNEIQSYYLSKNSNEFKHELSSNIQFSDFAIWQRKYLTKHYLDSDANYWTNKLAACDMLNTFESTRIREGAFSFSGDEYHFNIDNSYYMQLRKSYDKSNMTLFMLMLSIFSFVLSKYLNKTDILIGCPVSNRHFPGVENLIGFFTNTIVMRCDVDNQQTIKQYFENVRSLVIDALDHQDMPFDNLVKLMSLDREKNISPLFQIMLVVLNDNEKVMNLSNVKAEYMHYGTKTSKMDLTLYVREKNAELHFWFEYSDTVFTRLAIETFTNHFVNVFKGFCLNNSKKISDISLMGRDELDHLFNLYNQSNLTALSDKNVQDYFVSHAITSPDDSAVVDSNKIITYRDLNILADDFATILQNEGIGSGHRVGVYLEKSASLIASILAILKIKAVYIPISKLFPMSRIRTILSDSNPVAIITEADAEIPNDIGVKVFRRQAGSIYHDSSYDGGANQIDSAEEALNSAYIIYTSGSTGKPKGIYLSNKTLVNLIDWHRNTFLDSRKKYRIGLSSNIIFDVATQSIFLALATGNTLVTIPDNVTADYSKFFEFIYTNKISILLITPSILKNLASCSQFITNELDSLEQVIVSGETLIITKQIREFFNKLPSCMLINQYGPSETHVVTSYTMPKNRDDWENFPPIGKFIDNVKVYILDENLMPTPIGIKGEIYIGGSALESGYINNEKLNSTKFISNPNNTVSPEDRLYKSGDIAFMDDMGLIHFVGRQDDMVKINGIRIETDEIDFAVMSFIDIKDAVTIVKADENQRSYLLTYIVPENDSIIDFEKIKLHLRETLPVYMIPAVFQLINAIPLTLTGKKDKQKLLNYKTKIKCHGYVAPRDNIDERLIVIWKNILGITDSTIGIYDSFFNLGGDSLLVTQLLFRVNKEFNKIVSIENFFNSPTIYTLSNTISNKIEFTVNDYSEDFSCLEKILSQYSPKKIGLKANIFKNILLTGATGFVGSHLLVSLLKKTQAKIYCLIRDNNSDDAINRIYKSLSFYKLDFSSVKDRLIVVVGDLSKTNFGLSDEYYTDLAGTIDTIYHAGAFVHHIFGFDQLRSINVGGTLEIIKFSLIRNLKNIIYLSTIAAAHDTDENGFILEDFPKMNTVNNASGYAVTKWLSESLLRDAWKAGVDCSIYRLPFIIGDPEKDVAPLENNHLFLFIKSCIQMGSGPENWGKLDFMTVDVLSEVIVDSSLIPSTAGKVYNLTNPYACDWTEIFETLNKFGHKIKLINSSDWLNMCLNNADEKNALYPLLPLYMTGIINSETNKQKSHSANAYAIMNYSGHIYPKLNADMFGAYLDKIQTWLST
jgi:amino acid adenylation domain-containing protein/thioester reductase-like protein